MYSTSMISSLFVSFASTKPIPHLLLKKTFSSKSDGRSKLPGLLYASSTLNI